jgi:hypothetical protein
MGRVTKGAWAKSSLRTKEVDVEELGGTVLIRELPASVTADLSGLIDMVQVGKEQRAKVDVASMERRQFALGVVTDDGKPMFTEEEAGEIQTKHGRAYKTVVNAIDELSGVRKEDLEETEARFPGRRNGAPDGGEARLHEVAPDADGSDSAA